MSEREDVVIESHGETLAAWVYAARRSNGSDKRGPAIILAHGLGAIKEMRLDVYCKRFSLAGYLCLAFDYRCAGESSGKPRGLVDLKMQYQDWIQAIKYVRTLPQVDRNRIAVFSITFGVGNIIRLAAQDYGLKAVICQNPLLGRVVGTSTDARDIPALIMLGFRDLFFGTDDHPITVPIHSVPGHGECLSHNTELQVHSLMVATVLQASLSKSYDTQTGYKALLPPNFPHHPNAIPARFVLNTPYMRPGAEIANVKVPIFFTICGRDNIAPPKRALKWARKAPDATVAYFENLTHFEIYEGEAFEMAMGQYLQFLRDKMPIAAIKAYSKEIPTIDSFY